MNIKKLVVSGITRVGGAPALVLSQLAVPETHYFSEQRLATDEGQPLEVVIVNEKMAESIGKLLKVLEG